MEKHFVTFYSPGTFMPEMTEKPIASWDVEVAKGMALAVSERYNATPYAFKFTTRGRGPDDLDSKVIRSSNLYFLGGRIETLAEVEARNDPKEEILRSNMRGNGIKRIIINDNSWRFTGEFHDDDVLLDFTPPPRKSAEEKLEQP